MKTFVYTVTKRRMSSAGNNRDTLTVYQIVNNTPRLIAADVPRGYRTEAQAAFAVVTEAGAVKASEKTPSFFHMEQAGIARLIAI